MKVLKRAGGRRPYLSEVAKFKPKPVVEIGNKPTAGLCDYSSLES